MIDVAAEIVMLFLGFAIGFALRAICTEREK
jgi:hypothetical protein